MEYPVIDIIDEQPTFEKPIQEILVTCQKGGVLKVLTPLEYHTERQRKWYKGVCLRELSDWNGDTIDEWDLRLKALCGGDELLKKETIYLGQGITCNRPTIVGVGKLKMTRYIENILSRAITEGWPVSPPDPDLRSK